MKIKPTEAYLVKIDSPWASKGEVRQEEYCSKYPEIFARQYVFEGTSWHITLGDKIWREDTKTYERTPKAIQFTEAHLNCDFEVFPTKEECEKYIAEKEAKREKTYSQHSIYDAIEKIQLFSSVDFDKLSFNELKNKFQYINQTAKEALKTLRDESKN